MVHTFSYRDQRRLRVQAALSALTPAIAALQVQRDNLAADPGHDPAALALLDQSLQNRRGWLTDLERERLVLASSNWKAADTTYRVVVADWLWNSALVIRPQLEADPVLLSLGEQPKFTSAFEQALGALNLGVGAGPPENLLTTILTAAGGQPELVDELVFAAHRLWLARTNDATSPHDHVCTLLPLRIETIFVSGDDGEELWIRLTPDEPSISRHRPLVTNTEKKFVQEFWTELRKQIPAPPAQPAQWLVGPAAATEFETLAARVGAPRAAWLIAKFLPTIQNNQPVIKISENHVGTTAQERQQADAVLALPAEMEVWVLNGSPTNPDRLRLGVLQPKDPVTNQPVARSPTDLRMPLPDKSLRDGNFKSHWLTDFDAAIRVGLGGRLKLPAGVSKDSIQALFVIGQGDETLDELLEAHSAAGTLGVLRLGAPTNSVHGAPAASLAKDAAAWFDVVQHRLNIPAGNPKYYEQQLAFRRISQILLGDENAPFCPVPRGGEFDPVDDVAESRRFVRALWPVLWGHFVRDHLAMQPSGTDPDAYDVWRWCNDFLFPEGPLAPIRIHDQPYGLLPVSTLADWSATDSGDEQLAKLEAMLVESLKFVRRELLQNSQPPTIVGADTSGILNVLGRDATTQKYMYRFWMQFDFFQTYFNTLIHANGVNPGEAWASTFHVPLGNFAPRTASPHIALGWPQYLDLPLIAATRRPYGLRMSQLIEDIWDRNSWTNVSLETLRRILPDSLCIRLMMEALMLAQAWAGQEVTNTVEPLINPVGWPPGESLVQKKRLLFNAGAVTEPLRRLADRLLKANFELGEHLDVRLEEDRDPLADPNAQDPRIWRMNIPADRLAQLERAFRATLDTASHRIDPWITGLAWRRLDAASRSSRRMYSTGVYGWVDGPLKGERGPTNAGLLHAPSHAQAISSIVLRSKYLSADQSGAVALGNNVWKMSIHSAVARKALELAAECRSGFHLYEVVGRQVERVVGDFQQIRTLRRLRPLHPPADDPMVVCHGIHALNAVLSTTALPEADLNAIRMGLSPAQKSELTLVQESLDAYADLLIADAVHHIVTGQAKRAGDAMDAEAGLGQIPAMDSIRTPPSGYRIQSTVVSMFPWTDSPAMPAQASPSQIAEPSLAAHLATQFAQPASYVWRVLKKNTNPIVAVGTVSLSDLGWSMAEAALLPQLVLAEIVCAKLGEEHIAENLDVIAPRQYFACRQLWGSLAQKPADDNVFLSSNELGNAGRRESTAVVTELTSRYNVLRAQLNDLFNNTKSLANSAGDVDALAARKLMRAILTWGIVPALEPTQQRKMYRFVFAATAEDSATIKGWLSAGVKSVEDRLKRSDTTPSSTIQALAKSIAELACSEGKLSVFAKWRTFDFRNVSDLNALTPDAAFDSTWLTQVATVRPALARIESLQLQSELQQTHAALTAWTNKPGDPWQTQFVQAKRAQAADFRLQDSPPHFVAGYGPAGVWQYDYLAVGLIDDFGESIPVTQRQTFAGFGFNAPASRPQQAILLAVPPRPRTQLTNEVLLQIVIETREGVRVRALRPEDMRNGRALTSAMWFPASGPDRVRLDADTQFWHLE